MAGSISQLRRGSRGESALAGTLSAVDFAWEFLRRNPEYQADYKRGRGHEIDPRWGLRFAADPSQPAPNASVYWRAEVAPGLVVPMEGEAERLSSLALRGPIRRADDGWHLNLKGGAQLNVRDQAGRTTSLVVVLAFDKDYRLRLKAAQALAATTTRTRLTLAQDLRLRRAVLALDGATSGQSYRTIAAHIFGAASIEREPWKTASIRDVTIRLVRTGRSMMRGGYLKLVWGGP